MATNTQIIQKAAAALGLCYSENKLVGYGRYGGFTMMIRSCPPNSGKKTINLHIYAEKDGQPADKELFASLLTEDGVDCVDNGFLIVFEVKEKFKASDVIETLANIGKNAVSVLAENGYVNCSSNGIEGQTDIYLMKDQYLFLTAEEVAEAGSMMNEARRQYDDMPENFPMGILGGLAGSLAGVLAILLIGRLGRASFFGGAIMGIVSIMGYKKLGNKLSAQGAILCTVISVIMSYLAFRLDTAISLVNIFKDTVYASEFTFSYCFSNAKAIFEMGDSLDTYNMNMFMIMLSGVGGAATTIWADRSKTKKSFVLTKLGYK